MTTEHKIIVLFSEDTGDRIFMFFTLFVPWVAGMVTILRMMFLTDG